jgi:predicted lipoprotein with Yx(FWY)xxD motif
MRKLFVPIVAVAAVAFATASFAQTAPTKTGDSTKGKVLTDGKGMTLYTFDKDAGGKSACNGPCVTNWPPLMASADAKTAGAYTIITRDDGATSGPIKASRFTLGTKIKSPVISPVMDFSMVPGTSHSHRR